MLKIMMMIGIALTAAAPAHSQAVIGSPSEWHDANYACRMGETREGVVLDPAAIDASCKARQELGGELMADGYCWSSPEQEWFVVGEDDILCDEGPLD